MFFSRNVFDEKPRKRKSVEMTIPDACRTLQNLYADNGNQWKDILGWESKKFRKITKNVKILKNLSKILNECLFFIIWLVLN